MTYSIKEEERIEQEEFRIECETSAADILSDYDWQATLRKLAIAALKSKDDKAMADILSHVGVDMKEFITKSMKDRNDQD